MTPLLTLVRFEVGRLLRSWRFLLITIGFPVIFYVLFLGDRSAGGVIDGTVPWRLYLVVSMCSFGALVAALTSSGGRLSAERTTGWARQLRVTPIPAWSYVAAKVAAGMVVILPVLALVDVVGASFGGVHIPLATWLELTALLWVTALPFAILGALIGFTVQPETAFPVVTALMFVLGYFGGLFNPVSSMPRALQVAARALPSFHQAALGIALLDGKGFGYANALVLTGYTVVLGAAVTLKHHLDESRGLA